MLLLPTKSNELQPGRYQANHLQIANIFVCPNCIWSIVAELHFLSLSLGLSRLCGGYQATHLLTGRRVSHFPTHPRFPDFLARISSNSRNGFTEYLQFICPLIGC